MVGHLAGVEPDGRTIAAAVFMRTPGGGRTVVAVGAGGDDLRPLATGAGADGVLDRPPRGGIAFDARMEHPDGRGVAVVASSTGPGR